MSTPRTTGETRPEVAAIIAAWPPGAWLTEWELAEHLAAAGHPVRLAPYGWCYGSHKIQGLLNSARRLGWLIRQGPEPTSFTRTPTGEKATAREATADA